MSTRCTVHFGVGGDAHGGEVIIYKHYDGYPDNMVPLLQRFLSREGEIYHDSRRNDPSYLAARFVHYLTTVDDEDYDGLGVGICATDPGDIAFSYLVNNNGAFTVRDVYGIACV